LLHGQNIPIFVIGGIGVDAIAHRRGKVYPGRLIPGAAVLVEVQEQESVGRIIPKSVGPLLAVALAAPFVASNVAVQLVGGNL